MTSRLSLKRFHRIKKSVDFDVVYRTGYKMTGSFYSLVFLKNSLPNSRLGITVSRRVGGAVLRNRIKRLVRETFRVKKDDFRQSFDVVVTALYYPKNHPDRAGLELARLFECLSGFETYSEK